MTLQARRDDLYRHYEGVRAELLAAIDGLTPAQLVDQSIDGWSVQDHLAHLTVWDEIRVAEIDRVSSGLQAAWPIMTDEQVEALNWLTVTLRRTLPLAQVQAELAGARQRVFEAIARATERGLDESLYGEAGLRSSHDAAHAAFIRAWRARLGI